MFKIKEPEGSVKEFDFMQDEKRPAQKKHLTEEDCALVYRSFLNRICEFSKYFVSEENKYPKEIRGKLENVLGTYGNYPHLFIFPDELKRVFANCCVERKFLNLDSIRYDGLDELFFKEFIKWLKGKDLLPNGTGDGSVEDLSLEPRVKLTRIIGDFYHDTIEIIINERLAMREDELKDINESNKEYWL